MHTRALQHTHIHTHTHTHVFPYVWGLLCQIQVSKCTHLAEFSHLCQFPLNGANLTHLPPDPNVITVTNLRALTQQQQTNTNKPK